MISCLGSLVQWCCGEGGTLQTNITGVCGACSQCLGHTEFAPARGVCAFPVYTARASGCSAGSGLWVACTSQNYAVQVPRYSTKAQTQLGLCFVPFPGLSNSGDQVFGKRAVPRYSASHHLPGPSHLVSWVRSGCAVCLLWIADLWL